MSYGVSDEVAEDFKLALEDLTMNSRYEISNLTVIAKENTEHALAISDALKDHIKKVGQFNTSERQSPTLHSRTLVALGYHLTLHSTNIVTDCPSEETSCLISPRLDRKERWHTLHTLLWSSTIWYFHGIIRSCRQQHQEEDGGNVEDLEGASARICRHSPGFSARCDQAN